MGIPDISIIDVGVRESKQNQPTFDKLDKYNSYKSLFTLLPVAKLIGDVTAGYFICNFPYNLKTRI
jgi:hypothetical protein